MLPSIRSIREASGVSDHHESTKNGGLIEKKACFSQRFQTWETMVRRARAQVKTAGVSSFNEMNVAYRAAESVTFPATYNTMAILPEFSRR